MDINETTFPPVVAEILAMSAGRVGATVAAVIGLIGTVVGGMALARARGRRGPGSAPGGQGRPGSALALGAVAVVLGAVYAATADGGLGTGNGLGGAVVAVVLGLIAMALGGLARARGRGVA